MKFFKKKAAKNTFDLYTDGSAKEGRSSWAFVVVQNAVIVHEASAGQKKAGSNLMEIHAAIEGLRFFKKPSIITVFSDSRTLIDAFDRIDKRPLAFSEQFLILDLLVKEHQVTWRWIKGHSGNIYNERCDELCTQSLLKS